MRRQGLHCLAISYFSLGISTSQSLAYPKLKFDSSNIQSCVCEWGGGGAFSLKWVKCTHTHTQNVTQKLLCRKEVQLLWWWSLASTLWWNRWITISSEIIQTLTNEFCLTYTCNALNKTVCTQQIYLTLWHRGGIKRTFLHCYRSDQDPIPFMFNALYEHSADIFIF